MAKKVFLLGSAHPYKVGSAQFNERLAQAFMKEEIDLTIYTFKLQYPKFLFPGQTQFSDKQKPALKIVRLINTINPFNWIAVGKKIKKQKPDYIIIRYMMPFMAPSMGTIARIAKKNKHTKVIALVDNVVPHEKRFFDSILTKYFLKSCDKFLYMSQKIKKDLSKFHIHQNTAFCPHPLFDNYGEKVNKEVALEKLNLNKQAKYILFFGLIRNYKGLDLLLKSLNHTYFKENNIKLIVAGEFYVEEKEYTSIIEKHQLQKQVIIHNRYIDDKDVPLYFSVVDLLVLPYKTATQSGVTQVGFYYNTPMVVTNVGGLPELINSKIGYVVEPNEKDIQHALLDFFMHNKHAKMTSEIELEKQKFSWKNMVQTFNSLANEN